MDNEKKTLNTINNLEVSLNNLEVSLFKFGLVSQDGRIGRALRGLIVMDSCVFYNELMDYWECHGYI